MSHSILSFVRPLLVVVVGCGDVTGFAALITESTDSCRFNSRPSLVSWTVSNISGVGDPGMAATTVAVNVHVRQGTAHPYGLR